MCLLVIKLAFSCKLCPRPTCCFLHSFISFRHRLFFQTSTLHNLFNYSNKPYGSSVRVKVIAQGALASNSNHYGVADETMAVEVVLYDETKASKMQCGRYVTIINAMVKNQPHKQIQISKSTRVGSAGSFDVPLALEQAATDLVNPQAATFVSLSEVKTSPIKKLMSVHGQVVAVSTLP